MGKPKLHLDADISRKALVEGLLARGHDVTRTPQLDLPMDASDEFQLLWSASQCRIIFTHNMRDYIGKSEKYPNHQGILLAHRDSYSLGRLIEALDRMLSTTTSEEWIGQVRWLSDWA